MTCPETGLISICFLSGDEQPRYNSRGSFVRRGSYPSAGVGFHRHSAEPRVHCKGGRARPALNRPKRESRPRGLLLQKGRPFLAAVERSWRLLEARVRGDLPLGPGSAPSVCVSVFMLAPHCFDHCSFVISFEITTCESYNVVFLFQDFEYWGPLRFHMRFRMKFSIPAKSLVEILTGIVLHL